MQFIKHVSNTRGRCRTALSWINWWSIVTSQSPRLALFPYTSLGWNFTFVYYVLVYPIIIPRRFHILGCYSDRSWGRGCSDPQLVFYIIIKCIIKERALYTSSCLHRFNLRISERLTGHRSDSKLVRWRAFFVIFFFANQNTRLLQPGQISIIQSISANIYLYTCTYVKGHGRIPIDPAILVAIGHRFIAKKRN